MNAKPARMEDSPPEIHQHVHIHQPPPQPPLRFTPDGKLITHDDHVANIAAGISLLGLLVIGYIAIHVFVFALAVAYIFLGGVGVFLVCAMPIIGILLAWMQATSPGRQIQGRA